MAHERPLGLWMGDVTGALTAHSDPRAPRGVNPPPRTPPSPPATIIPPMVGGGDQPQEDAVIIA